MNELPNKPLPVSEQLSSFLRKVRQLQQRKGFNAISSYESSLNMTWSEGSDLKITKLEMPDSELFRSFLIDFRHFIANDSSLNINKLLRVLINRARHIAFRTELIERQTVWKEMNQTLPSSSTESPEGVVLSKQSGKDSFLLWLNGTVFHCDPEAEEFFNNLGMLKTIYEFRYVRYVGACTNFILHLAVRVELALNMNELDLLNEFTPHVKPKITIKIETDADKKLVFTFWRGTRNLSQTLSICDEHDQDVVIAVKGLKDGGESLDDLHIELRGCCQAAIDSALNTIRCTLAWVEYLRQHDSHNSLEPIEIIEVKISDRSILNQIRLSLHNGRVGWRRHVGHLRCPVHRMPPGLRGFGLDMYSQGVKENKESVYIQGCCEPFIHKVLSALEPEI